MIIVKGILKSKNEKQIALYKLNRKPVFYVTRKTGFSEYRILSI